LGRAALTRRLGNNCSTNAVARFATASAFAAWMVLAGIQYPPVAAAQSPTVENNPFTTPEERAAAAKSTSPASAENPFATPMERVEDMPAALPEGQSVRRLLMHREPFDVVVLRERPPREVEVLPLDFPGRKVPITPAAGTSLQMKLLPDPENAYHALWSDVVEVRLFENMVLAEARKLADDGHFDDAFAVFSFLNTRYPTLAGLADAEQHAVKREAEQAIAAERWEHALALCLRFNELKARNPDLAKILPPTVQGLVDKRIQERHLAAARRAVDVLASLLPEDSMTTTLNGKLSAAVADQVRQAEQNLSAGDALAAQDLLVGALALAPAHAQAKELLEKAVAARPRVVVAVSGPPAFEEDRSFSLARGDAWNARRVAELISGPSLRLAASQNGTAFQYQAGWARWAADPNDALLGELVVPAGSAYEIAQTLLAAADPEAVDFQRSWADLKPRIEVVVPDRVRIEFTKLHPRPEAIVGAIFDAAARAGGFASSGSYRLLNDSDTDVTRRYERVRDTSSAVGGLAEIVERRFTDEEEAVAALRVGEVDVVDRIAPWQLASLRGQREVQLVRYAPLSVHCLTIRSRHPLLASAEFRRALLYAIDRESILKHHLQVADQNEGTRPASGVFSRGRTPDDPLGYADDAGLTPRPYDLQAAYILSRLAPGSGTPVAAERRFVLGYPTNLTALRACEQIRRYWLRIGVDVELRPLATMSNAPDEIDLLYTVVAAPEPLIDADRLFGAGGIVPQAERQMLAPLRQLAAAATFSEARSALYEIQRTVHEQAIVLPLWQINEYAAKRTRLTVGPAAPLTLYQYVDQWRITPSVNVPLP
jgi:hypothetical protein